MTAHSTAPGGILGVVRTVSFRLALSYGVVIIAGMGVISVLLYYSTIGVLSGRIDGALSDTMNHLASNAAASGPDRLRQTIDRALNDGIDSDTEVYYLADPNGAKITGNLAGLPPIALSGDTVIPGVLQLDQFINAPVMRAGRPSLSRLLLHKLSDGSILVVGRDMQDQLEINRLIWRALLIGAVFSLILALSGAFLFRWQVERRIATIRRTAQEIEDGNLALRIPVSSGDDEFSRLSLDINHMLDWISQLMEGVRHVSNAIAHDLRTPLARVRNRLDGALKTGREPEQLRDAARLSIESIDELIAVFDKLLQISEAESGARRRTFEPTALGPILIATVDLYDAVAEDRGITLIAEEENAPLILGDKDLLARAVANLVDNALKYAGNGSTVRLSLVEADTTVAIHVRDNGPGIQPEDRDKMVKRFYRGDLGRGQPGNGLGLSLVAAVTSLHGGSLHLDDAFPGLLARIVLPRALP